MEATLDIFECDLAPGVLKVLVIIPKRVFLAFIILGESLLKHS